MKHAFAVTIAALALAAAAFAQTSEVKTRAHDQQERIGQGVESGQLTAGETANLEKKEARINREIRTDRAANGGRLTPGEKAAINRQQNRLSGQIYAEKHNAAVQKYGNNEVDQRRRNQQQRIGEGIESGRLNAGETARLEKSEAAVNREVRTDRAANGGRLTPGEKAAVNRQQNRLSRRIHRDKHN